jgi:hypothetical protein
MRDDLPKRPPLVKGYGDPYAEPAPGTRFNAMLEIVVGHANGDFRHILVKDQEGRTLADGSVPWRTLKEIKEGDA